MLQILTTELPEKEGLLINIAAYILWAPNNTKFLKNVFHIKDIIFQIKRFVFSLFNIVNL